MTSEQQDQVGDHPVAVDGYLRFLVQQVNERGLPLRVTLSVGGSVVSGILTGERQYFEGLTKALQLVVGRSQPREQYERSATIAKVALQEEGVSGEKVPTAEDLAARTTEAVVERIVGDYDRTGEGAPRYIHLRDVKNMTPGLQSAETGGLWRGRLNAVDGFMFGSAGPRVTGGGGSPTG